MRRNFNLSLLVALIGASFLLESCGGGSTPSSALNVATLPSAPPPPTPTISCAPLSAGLAPTTICGLSPPLAPSQSAAPFSCQAAVSSAVPMPSASSVTFSGGRGGGGSITKSPVSYNGGPLFVCANVVVLCINASCTSYGVDGGGENHNETPCDFWNRLDISPMIHITDEYVNQTGDNRYVCAKSIEVDGVPTGGLSDQQMLDIITANLDGSGVNTVYNLFMTDTQLNQGAGVCAFHTSAQISVSGQSSTITYTANANCGAEDDMNHEMFESITDPGADNSGWVSSGSGRNNEIADLCENTESQTTLNGSSYTLQPIWSNAQGACTYAPR